MRAFLSCLPALMAALLLSVLPACASSQQPTLPPAVEGMLERPRNAHVPTSPDDVSGIQRGAGGLEPPRIHGDDEWAAMFLLVFYGVVYVGYTIGWCFVALGELIYECFEDANAGTDDSESRDDNGADEQPEEQTTESKK